MTQTCKGTFGNPENLENLENPENLENLENPENLENLENPEPPEKLCLRRDHLIYYLYIS